MTNIRAGNPNYVPNPDLIAAHRTRLTGVLKIYDQILAKQPYIGGATFTIADLYHLPYMLFLTKLGKMSISGKDCRMLRNGIRIFRKEIVQKPSPSKITTIASLDI